MDKYESLKYKLMQKETRAKLRYTFYEMKNVNMDFGISSPPNLRQWQSVLGWCAKAVDSLADRLVFREFRNDFFDISGVYRLNNPDVLFDSAILSALISACCFIYIVPDAVDGIPKMQVIDGMNATGNIDPVTGMLTEGYAVLERDAQTKHPTVEAYFETGKTTIYRKGEAGETYINNAPYPLLVPIIFRPDPVRPFGHSRISRACMSLVGSALRTVKRAEISAEFYSFPQKYATGVSPDLEMDKWRAAMSYMMTFTKDDDGEAPKLGQFTQQSMQPHTDQLRMFASLFAGETGLTLDDLGFATQNPSSADAIKAAHENLRMTARKAQRTFSVGFLNAGFLAACVRDNFAYQRRMLYDTKAIWEPVFEPDAAMLSAIGDGAIKINNAIPNYFTAETLRDLTGIDAGVAANAGATANENAEAILEEPTEE